MKKQEEKLEGGQSAESVIRIGNTVYRTTKGRPTNELGHAILKYLEANNFTYSPRFLGLDEKGREMLSYFEGEVPRGIVMSDQQLIACMRILRKFHDLSSKSSLCGQHETICHNDFAPWNMIFKNGEPIGIIDFDEVNPGLRIDDIAYFIWTFLDLGLGKTTDATQIDRIVNLIDTYQPENRADLIPAILRQQDRILKFRKNSAINEEVEEKRAFSQQAVYNIQTAIQWVNSNSSHIEDRLKL